VEAKDTRRILVDPSGLGPRLQGGSSGYGLLPRGCRFCFAFPLRLVGRTRRPSGRDVTTLSLLQDKRDIVDDVQPLGIVIRKVLEARRDSSCLSLDPTCALLLQVSCVRPIPPCEAHNDQKYTLGTTGEDIRPLCWVLGKRVLPGTAPLWLDPLPPLGDFNAETRNREGVTSRGLMSILEVLFNLGWTVLACKSRPL
jgi:hypothetical protein